MLQEITESDLEYDRGGLSKENLLKIYDVIRKHQDELELKDYSFNKYYVWSFSGMPQRSISFLKPISSRSEDHTFTRLIKMKYREITALLRKEYPGKFQDGYQLGNYLNVLFNHFLPDSSQKAKIEISKIYEEKKKETEQKTDKKKNYDKVDNAYIYGIYIDNKIAYIGKTIRDIKTRLGEHIECALLGKGGGHQQNYLYKAMRECEIGYKFKILYESHNTISNHELEEIEKTLIENLKPAFNYEGVKVPYRFSEEK